MKSRSTALLLALPAAALCVGAAVWLFVHGRTQAPAAVAPATASVPADDHEFDPRVPGAGVRELVRPSELAPGTGVAPRGKLLFPPGTPADERAQVLVSGKDREIVAFPVARDGSFQLEFQPQTRISWLRVKGKYLYTPWQQVSPRSLPEGFEIRPESGGRVVGIVVPPPGAKNAREVLSKMEVQATFPSQSLGPASGQNTARLDSKNRFELNALPAAVRIEIKGASGEWLSKVRSLELKPFQTQEIELHFSLGARVSGRVHDEGGGSLAAGVLVVEDMASGTGIPVARTKLAQDGAFDLAGLPPGTLRLRAQMHGRLDALLPLAPLADGSHASGLELTLTYGGILAGRVVWDLSGLPVEGAQVTVLEPGAPARLGMIKAETDDQGVFRVTGLENRVYVLMAQKRERSGSTAAPQALAIDLKDSAYTLQAQKRALSDSNSAPQAHERVLPDWSAYEPDQGKRKGLAILEAIQPDGQPLELRLQAPLVMRGRVLDAAGNPVRKFSVYAEPSERAWLTEDRQRDFKDGLFELPDMRQGRWNITVRAAGFAAAPPLEVDLDAYTPALEIRLEPALGLTGLVLKPDGSPCGRASIHAARQIGGSWTSVGATSAADGSFRIPDAPPGLWRIHASAQAFATSPAMDIEVARGMPVGELVLRLRAGSRLTGQLDLGPPLPGKPPPAVAARVIYALGPGAPRTAKTDDEGSFEFRGLDAGEYSVDLLDIARAQVTLREGEDAHVVLRPLPAETAVLSKSSLTGRVVDADGGPVAKAVVSLEPQGEDTALHHRGGTLTDASGAFAFVGIPSGSYTLSARPPVVRGTRRPFAEVRLERVHLVGNLEGVELRLPRAGVLHGIVSRPDGARASRASVFALAAGFSARSVETDPDGRYRFEGLPPAAWSLSASEGTLVAPASAALVINGQALEHNLELRQGTRLVVLVQDEKGAAVSATLGVTDLHGRDASHGAQRSSISEHRLGPLAPGTYRIHALGAGGRSGALQLSLAGEPQKSVIVRLAN